jgi:transitional endoplasmic reticulum ATPase
MSLRTTLQIQRAKWFLNLLAQIKPESLESKGIVSFIASRKAIFGITLPKGFTVQENPKSKGQDELVNIDDEAVTNSTLKQKRISRFQKIRELLQKSVELGASSKNVQISDVERNLSLLTQRINLSPEESNILLFYVDFLGSHYQDVIDQLRDVYDSQSYFQAASKLLGMGWEELRDKLSTRSVLRNFISFDPNAGFYSSNSVDVVSNKAFSADNSFIKVISEPATSADSIIGKLLGPTPNTELTLADFAYLGEDKLAYFVETLRGAVEGNGKARKNASLYGLPGVGKTEFTVVIAKHLGVSLYAIGLSHLDDENFLSDNAKEPTREDRLLAWRRASYLAKAANMKCLFLLDEADDILRDPNEDKNSDRASKAYLNWLLDSNNVPTIFVTNNIHLFEESTIRRIIPTLHIPSAPQAIQQNILMNYAEKYGMPISAERAKRLTTDYPQLTSAVIETIVYKTSKRIDVKGNPDKQFRALEIGFSEAAAALNHGSPPVPKITRTTIGFDTRLITAQLDIPALLEDFRGASSLAGLSVCLYGPQGSGKKSVLHYMAENLDLKTEFFDFSNLYGMQGFSVALLRVLLEKSIREKNLLVFNDVSRLLQQPDWTKLDSHPFFLATRNHPLPFAATIFDYDEADVEASAFYRLTGQFTFASRMSGLKTEGQKIALQSIVGLSEKDSDTVITRIEKAANLVVGDFIRVAKQMQFRPAMAKNPEAVYQALQYNAMQAGQPSLDSPFGT